MTAREYLCLVRVLVEPTDEIARVRADACRCARLNRLMLGDALINYGERESPMAQTYIGKNLFLYKTLDRIPSLATKRHGEIVPQI